MEEEKCDSCDTALTEENKCSCQPTKCKGCCTCEPGCECGCKGGEKKEEASEEAKPEGDGAAAEEEADDEDDDDEEVEDGEPADADKKDEVV